MSNVSDYKIGSRVVDGEGYKGSVRYIGTVAGAKNKSEIWLGIEWDIASRGRHDGSSVNDDGTVVKYFDCNSGAGSFVKPSKVSLGRSFLDALMERYVKLDAPLVAEENNTVFVNTLKGNQKAIEFVGENKIRKRQQIEVVQKVAVRNDTVSYIGTNISGTVGHLVEVDLQDNMLWEWKEIASLGMEISGLQVLLLHSNKMEPVTEDILTCAFPTKNCLSNLRVLALNSCRISSWHSVQLLEPYLPSLEELYLAGNHLTDLPRHQAEKEANYDATENSDSSQNSVVVSGFLNLRLLDCSCCSLDEWSQVMAFCSLPSLQELILDANPELKHVLPPCFAASSNGDAFSNLQRFSLSGTGLSSWFDVDMLSKYPGLRALRLSQIPLFIGKGSSEVRPEVIARIQQLTFFNGSQILGRERTESEKNYLRSVAYEKQEHDIYKLPEQPPKGTSPALLSELADCGKLNSDRKGVLIHPRYSELFEKYGADLIPTTKAAVAGATTLSAELISVTFRNLSFGAGGSLEPITKKIPRTLTVGRLRLIIKQLYGLEPRMQDLSVRVYKDAVPTLLDDDEAQLQYYGACEGAEIFINDANV